MPRGNSQLVAWALLVAGMLAATLAWRDRQPSTTADFTLFYASARESSPAMYGQKPRGNMNPPLFQLMVRPLTRFPLPVAATIFRVLSIAALCACLWWLARTSRERWDVGDIGALLAWAPMASVLSLNQLTWLLWPLLIATWWCWRTERWTAGAIAYGIALSLKPFLGVFLLWLLVTRRWRPAAVAMSVSAAGFAIGVLAYGVEVSEAWLRALGSVTWEYAPMNASLAGFLARVSPDAAIRFGAAGGAAIVLVTLIRTGRRSIDDSWLPLMVTALLASPLGWLYYIWWIMPGTRPSKLLFETPLLWVPMAFTIMFGRDAWAALTFGSVYFWGLLLLWVTTMLTNPTRPSSVDHHLSAPDHFGLAPVLVEHRP